MHASKWPFPTRPTTNTLIQVMLAMFVGFLLMTFPVPVIGIGAALVVFFGGRGILRELRKEWRKP